ncbi:MAG: hypothetical protein SGI88_17785 [Candidatus Hydrogenedentes bacterium]|nr:hypothetical protein [Candidatus Hydrogenedentota bacterium]
MKLWAHKGIGALAILAGCVWALSEGFPGGSTSFDWTFFIISLTPGFFAIFYGMKVFKTPNNANITRSVGVLLFFVMVLLLRGLVEWVGESYRSDAYNSALVLIVFALMPAYVWISSAVMRWNGINSTSWSDYFSRPFALLLSLCVWTALIELTDIFFAMAELDLRKILLVSILTFGPLLVSIVFYKLFIKFLGLDNVRPQSTEIRHA